jgi:hypothetical protein
MKGRFIYRILFSLRNVDKYLRAKETAKVKAKVKVSVMKENSTSAVEYLFKSRLHKTSSIYDVIKQTITYMDSRSTSGKDKNIRKKRKNFESSSLPLLTLRGTKQEKLRQ